MRVLQVNVVCGYSTGRIAVDIQNYLIQKGDESVIAYGRGECPGNTGFHKIGNTADIYMHLIKARLNDGQGYASKKATQSFIQFIDEFAPDMIHLHNIHGYYLNNKILFEYLAKINKPIVWTLHDLWLSTGHCAYPGECKKWLSHCEECPRINQYPVSFTDKSKRNFADKKRLFTAPENITLVSPSKWIQNLADQSYMGKYPNVLINNGIDLNIFKPLPNREELIKKRNLSGDRSKKILLAVSSVFDERKGLNYIYQISEMLDENWQVLIVGLNQKQLEDLNQSNRKNISGFKRTKDINDLTAFYNMADVFCNTSVGDNYPTVNLEAMACGTPVVAFDTGGISEQVFEDGGFVVPFCDLNRFVEQINRAAALSRKSIAHRAADLFDKNTALKKYDELYQELWYNKP